MAEKVVPPVYATLVGDINTQLVQRTTGACFSGMQNGVSEVHFMIQSNGGFVNDGICLYNFLRNLPIAITTYNAGHVGSAAIWVYLAGSRRVSSATATFLLHRPYGGITGSNASAIRSAADGIALDEKRTGQIMRDILTLTPEQWDIYNRGDLFLSAADALKCGLIHEIADFAPPRGSQVANI